jgi:hypothetical protein
VAQAFDRTGLARFTTWPRESPGLEYARADGMRMDANPSSAPEGSVTARALAYRLLNPLLKLDRLRAELGSMLDGPAALASINAEIAEQLAAEEARAGC